MTKANKPSKRRLLVTVFPAKGADAELSVWREFTLIVKHTQRLRPPVGRPLR